MTLLKIKDLPKGNFRFTCLLQSTLKAHGQEFFELWCCKAVKYKDDNYVIGIDRGERNLIYISVIDSNGKIVEQISLNEIISDNGHRVDYQKLWTQKKRKEIKQEKIGLLLKI